MDLKKKMFYSIIRISILLLIIGYVSNYYTNQCQIYKDQMFEAMEDRDEAYAQISLLESKKQNPQSDKSLQNNSAELALELTAASERISELEKRWNILVDQKNGTNFSVRSNSGTTHFVMLSSYIGDHTTNVYHTADCDLLEAINDNDKIDLGDNVFSIRDNYKPCAWCLSK